MSDSYDIDLKELYYLIWKQKYFIISISLSAFVLSLMIAINIPNVYTSKSLLAPSSSEDSLSNKLGNFSSLRSLSGIQLPANKLSQSQEGIARIQSLEFFSEYFLPNISLENLTAVKGWSQIENKLIYNKKLFDSEKEIWVRDVAYPKEAKPSVQEAFKSYLSMLTISEDPENSIVTIAVKHYSPFIAKKYLDIIVNNINLCMKDKDEIKAMEAISYLNEAYKETNIQELKDVFTNLLQDQMQVLLLTSTSDEYAFKIIDKAFVPEEKSGPQRLLIIILGTLLGVLLSIIIVFSRDRKFFS